MDTIRTRAILTGSLVTLMLLGLAGPAQAQSDDEPESVYYRKSVRHADGTQCTHVPPEAAFTVFLNGDDSRVLLDDAPRWDDGPPNIEGNGTFGVELGNFPSLTVGDSVFVRFTDVATGQQELFRDHIHAIPWSDDNPFERLTLSETVLPARPAGLELETSGAARTLTWTAEQDDVTYTVYRRTLQDVLSDGRSRRLYRRVAEGLAEARFVDEASTDSTYGYVVYARAADGTWSAHSDEVVDAQYITGLAATAGATSVTLTWDAFTVPVGMTAGYNVYRRQEGGSYGDPIATTGFADPEDGARYVDSRLEPGQTYYYQVRARNQDYEVFGTSQEVAAATDASTEGTYTYANLKVAVVIYRNEDHHATGNRIRVSDEDVEEIEFLLDRARTFYWRNSGMKLNMELSYYLIDEHKNLGNDNVAETLAHLADFGITRAQYDMVFRIDPAVSGFWSVGTGPKAISLPGVDRNIGFFQIQWPLGSGSFDEYPAHFPGIDNSYSPIWLYIHEAQHTVDHLYYRNGHSEIGHGDYPEYYGMSELESGQAGAPGYPAGFGRRFGKRFDFQARMLHDFDAYEELLPEWGDIYETVDADGDGFPDADPRVPVDEVRFGSSIETADTDGDGYTDKQEALDGIYLYSTTDSHEADTDGDGVVDGEDEHPRYDVRTQVRHAGGRVPTVDGRLTDWPDEALAIQGVSMVTKGQRYDPQVYMTYDDEYFYMAWRMPHVAIPEVAFDFDADGRWFGAGNTQLVFDLTNDRFARFQTWDSSPEVRAWMRTCIDAGDCNFGKPEGAWDTHPKYQQQYGRRVVDPRDVELAIDLDYPQIRIEMAIPRSDRAGLMLQPGDTLGVRIDYGKVNNTPGVNATTFDQYSFVYFTLSDETLADVDPAQDEASFALAPNYPNPFAKETHIRFGVDEAGPVRLVVYDLLGRRVHTLEDRTLPPGTYDVVWDGIDASGRPVASGVYVYSLETPEGRRLTRRLTILR